MKEQNKALPIFLLHGLGGRSWSLQPLSVQLGWNGYERVYIVDYPVDELEIDESLDFLTNAMEKYVSKSERVVLIGQSMGGVMAHSLHSRGWDVALSISIGSPLHGAALLKTLDATLPTIVRNTFYKKPYGILMEKERQAAPPHPYHTISLGWFGSQFDGCVYADEATIDSAHHTHMSWADHRSVFFNPRLGWTVCEIMTEKLK